ncbi:unnamed protein product [Chrysodeixis includens]|uniref:Odorant receptor n=1 Tax=Chrysodeixis includens TaxID=689277 RepID=A0A9P0BZ84_CHRIL|nr:unnamed protein product [Chrysodeixis includens]
MRLKVPVIDMVMIFWIFHTILLFYVYLLGTVVYQIYYAEGFIDSINSFFNISVFVLISINSWWLLAKRRDINELLKIVQSNDDLVIESGRFLDIHQKMLKNIKIVVIMCYMFHFVNDVMIFIPTRTIGMDSFSVASCVGIPLDSSPNRQACMVILALQELTAIVAVASYDVTLLFLFSHTAATFRILYKDMMSFNELAERCNIWFWVVHLCLLVYVYCLGTIVYLWKQATSAQDSVKSFFNVSILLLVANGTWWILSKRSLLKQAVKKIEECDRLALHSTFFRQKHGQFIRHVKIVMFLFYGLNLSNGFIVYFPHRISIGNDYSMAQCVGMEPLTESPNGEICLTILALQEFTIMHVVLNYQSAQLILIEHASIMFRLLALEMNTLRENDAAVSKEMAKEILPSIIKRHGLLLEVIHTLKLLYSVTIGINFGSNAVCILLFFYIPLQEWLQFMPVLVYCFFVFFLYCFLCQRLTDSSELFETAVYCCGWENFDLKEKKTVFVMLRQSQKPVILKAADIVPVNIATFASTLQAMFKFVTVVKI